MLLKIADGLRRLCASVASIDDALVRNQRVRVPVLRFAHLDGETWVECDLTVGNARACFGAQVLAALVVDHKDDT